MKKLGNIGLGNFCKAVLEHKDIKIENKLLDITYNFKWHGNRYVDLASYLDDVDYTPTEIISLFLEDIYNMGYTYEL